MSDRDKGRGANDKKFYRNENAKRLYQHRNRSSFRDKVANISSFASKTVREKLMLTEDMTVPTWAQFVRSSLSIVDYQRQSIFISPRHDFIDHENMSTPRYLLSTPPEQYDSHWFPQYLQCQPCHVCNSLT